MDSVGIPWNSDGNVGIRRNSWGSVKTSELASRTPSSDSIPSMSEFLELAGLLSSPTNASQIPMAGGVGTTPTFAPATTQDDHLKLQLVRMHHELHDSH